MIPPNYSNPLTTLYLLKMGLLKLNLQSKLQTPFSLMMMLPSHHYLQLEQTTHLQHLDPHQLMHKRLCDNPPCGNYLPRGPRLTALQRTDLNPSIMSNVAVERIQEWPII
ncbi:hypothetical protein YC2023_079529 [Brassica napus]